MALSPGTLLGSYEILDLLGAGGMGEVYRARDTRLDRDVAIKILPEQFASDADRVARFEREAKTLAALSHPNIAVVYGVEQTGSVRALVMELVDGPTLAERIADGPVAVDDALPMARQIAAALEAAHAQGIVHRDLKPANIKVRGDGSVKVLDFGLAKALTGAAASGPDLTMSPTLSLHATQAGVILGTAAYMSPEQARGKAADTRADIWAFGVVCFEMLAGRRPFDGDEISDTLASILKSEPTWSLLPRDTPSGIVRLLRRCLHKDPQKRLQHIGDARIELDDPETITHRIGGDTTPRLSRRERLIWASALLLVLAAAGAIAWRNAPVPPPAERRVHVPHPGFGGYAISPDGRYVAYSADTGSGSQIWLRPILGSSTEPLAVPGTEDGNYPIWSPDSRSIAFFTSDSLKRIDLDGGNPITLAAVITPAGGTWHANTILYVPNDNGGVFRVSATGAEQPERITPGAPDSLATRRPQFLPDGRRYLFYIASGAQPSGVYIGEVDGTKMQRVLAADGPALYAKGHLWFVRDRTLLAQPFDLDEEKVTGSVATIAPAVPVTLFEAPIAASEAGLIAYRQGLEEVTARQLVWFDREGRRLGTIDDPDASLIANPETTRDGARLAVQRTVRQNTDVWTVDLTRPSSFVKSTDAPGIDSLPLWSPDGRRVLFNALSDTATDGAQFTITSIDQRDPNTRLRIDSDGRVVIACDWSPDGKYLLYKVFGYNSTRSTGTDLLAWPLDGNSEPVVVAQTTAEERDGQFSPDGGWVAYQSNQSGRPEIWLQPFPGPGEKVMVSVGGGRQVRWRPDGRELFYVAPDGMLMAVPINGALPAGRGTPKPLFKTSLAPVRNISRQQYAVVDNGQRFITVTREGDPPPITLILDWLPPERDRGGMP